MHRRDPDHSLSLGAIFETTWGEGGSGDARRRGLGIGLETKQISGESKNSLRLYKFSVFIGFMTWSQNISLHAMRALQGDGTQ